MKMKNKKEEQIAAKKRHKEQLTCRSYLVNKCLIASLLHLLVFA
ncbi:MAG: hypothetical protein ACI81T_004131, partial [Bacteroidia bacterium]